MTETERVSNEAANDRSDADRISSGAIDPSDLGTGATGIIETNTTISESDDALMHNNEARSFGSVSSRGIDEWNCCCPHGLYVLIPSILATMGWFARLTQDGCDYARLTGPLVAELTNDANIPYIEVGFNQYREPTTTINYVSGDIEWETSYKTQCSNYNTDIVTLDGVWTFAKIAGFISLVFGGAGTLFVWFSSCFRFSKTTWRWAGYELLIATITQLLVFSWFGTSLCHEDGNMCSLAYGSTADIMTATVWLMSTICIFAKFPLPKRGIVSASLSNDAERNNPPIPAELEMATQPNDGVELESESRMQRQSDEYGSQSNIPEIS